MVLLAASWLLFPVSTQLQIAELCSGASFETTRVRNTTFLVFTQSNLTCVAGSFIDFIVVFSIHASQYSPFPPSSGTLHSYPYSPLLMCFRSSLVARSLRASEVTTVLKKTILQSTAYKSSRTTCTQWKGQWRHQRGRRNVWNNHRHYEIHETKTHTRTHARTDYMGVHKYFGY